MNFRTRVDFTNRQAKQYEKTNINLSGGTVFGLPYSALTSGPDLTLTGITFSNAILQSTYSGNTGTTVYTFGDSRMSIDEGDLSALTPSNSATTQYAGPTWIGYDMFTTIDGYTGWTSYSAVTYDLDVVTMVDLGGGSYSGLVESDFIVYSAASVDYTGSTIWVDVSGITRTDELIVSKNPTIGYVLTCVDAQGKVSWEPTSGSTSGSTLYEIGTGSNSTQRISVGNSAGGNFSATLGGSGNTTSVGAQYATIVGGRNNSLTGAYNFIGGGEDNGNTTINWSSIVGGRGNNQRGEYSFIGGGRDNLIESFPSNYSTILGGRDNLIEGNNIHIIGSSITGTTDNTTYVNKFNIGTLPSGVTVNTLGIDINGNVISAPTSGTDTFTTGATLFGTTAYFDRTDSLSAYTLDFSSMSANTVWSGGSGTNSISAKNHNSVSSGVNSVSFGTGTTASGLYSFSSGYFNISSGNGSSTFGGGESYVGYPLATAVAPHSTSATTGGAIAIGGGTLASGSNSVASGSRSSATTRNTFAIGELTLASGIGSHAQGLQTRATGPYSHTQGRNTEASGLYSHASGFGSIASGSTSFVHGTDSVAVGNDTVVFGKGIIGTTNNTVYVPSLVIDGLTGVTDLQTDSTGKIIDGASDITLKDNVKSLTGSLDMILRLNPVSFEWIPGINLRQGTVYGLIAQEVNEVIPEIVRERAKGNGTLTLEYKELIPWLIGAIKELSSGTTKLNNELILESQTIASEDNNIELNYNGNHETAIGGGVTVLHAIKDDVHSEIKTDENGNWVMNPPLTTKQYTPTSTNDEFGKVGDTVWDNEYTYIKTNNGWKRSSLENF